MAVKYHISKKTGRPNICRAEIQACRANGDAGGNGEHFATKEEARASYEKEAGVEFGETQTVSKKSSTSEISWMAGSHKPVAEPKPEYSTSNESYIEKSRTETKATLADGREVQLAPYTNFERESLASVLDATEKALKGEKLTESEINTVVKKTWDHIPDNQSVALGDALRNVGNLSPTHKEHLNYFKETYRDFKKDARAGYLLNTHSEFRYDLQERMSSQPGLGTIPLEALRANVGETVATKELGGDVMTGKLVRVNTQDGKTPSSIVVDMNGTETVWPTQWQQATFLKD